ncbi:MAG TPA: phosphatidate cytidylyltransferase [Terriglobales bacterium]|nr:phosphatidate cytidylyltransferase [Terriglobales bacterium]
MKRVLTAAVLIPIVLLIVFRAPMWLFAAFVGLVALLATLEYLGIATSYCGKPLRAATLTTIVLLFLYTTVAAGLSLPQAMSGFEATFFVVVIPLFFVVVMPFIFLAIGMDGANLRNGTLVAMTSYFALPYIGLSLWSLVLVRYMSSWFVAFVLVVVWVGDTCAYYVGRGLGKHLLAPRISPKKTWEGSIASLLGGVLAGAALMHYCHQAPTGFTIGVGVLVNVAAQVGDLVESLMKRGAEVKDSGALLPGHGGILDRIDALLFAAPVAAILFAAGFFFGGTHGK